MVDGSALAGGGKGARSRPSIVFDGRPWRLAGVMVFLSYSGQFLMRFAPTGPQ
jgi:hypothetical protein